MLRSISAKAAPAEVQVASKAGAEEAAAETPNPGPSTPFSTFNASGQYQVCRPRTTPVTLIKHDVHNETEMARKAITLQHLQPSMLPNYYVKTIEIETPYPGAEPASESKSLQMKQEFVESKTRASVTLPLKVPKLAKPFPDPVKVMYSHTVSDQEKAEQMLAETKQAKQFQQRKSTGPGYTQQNRNYCTTVHYRRSQSPATLEQHKFFKKVYKAARLRPFTLKMPVVKEVSIVYPSCYGKFDFNRMRKLRTKSPAISKKVITPYPSFSDSFKELFNRKNFQHENGQYRTITNNAIEARKKKDCVQPPVDERTLPHEKKKHPSRRSNSPSSKKKKKGDPNKKKADGSGGNEPILMSEDLRYADREWQRIMSMLEGQNKQDGTDLSGSPDIHHHYQLPPTGQHNNTSGQI